MAHMATMKIDITGTDAFKEVVTRLESAERELKSLREYLDQHNDRLCRHDERVTGIERVADPFTRALLRELNTRGQA